VKKRGWALLSLECPHDRDCKDSFWQWDGDPSWVIDQVAALTKQIRIDPDRMFLIGWSGGASYIGAHAVAWAGTFAAVVFHGGGMAPHTTDCPKRLPAYFLVGDRNPLHHLAKDLRAYFDRCKQDVTWDLLKGADHAKEETALGPKKTQTILTWLEQQHT
jgi:predicted esterase